MRLLFDLLTFGGPSLVHWTAKKLTEEAEKEYLDEGRIRGELLELQERYAVGEVGEGEYDRKEKALLERLNAVREAKRDRQARS